jgi:hypothetical protein
MEAANLEERKSDSRPSVLRFSLLPLVVACPSLGYERGDTIPQWVICLTASADRPGTSIVYREAFFPARISVVTQLRRAIGPSEKDRAETPHILLVL